MRSRMARGAALACALSALHAQSWTRLNLDVQPGITYGKTARDTNRNQTVLFGGISALKPAGASSNETWLLSGYTWTQATPATAPSARVDHAMAFDAARGEVVLFGGCAMPVSPQTAQADTWVWNGTTWTKRTPASSPPARCGHAMAYDPIRRQIVLFGGKSPSSAVLADTWVWDGVTWTQAATSGTADTNPAMEWDPATGFILMVTYGSANQSVIRAWNGTAWSGALASTLALQPIVGIAPAAAGGMLLFEGAVGSPGRVWWWNGTEIRALNALPPVPSQLTYPALSWDPGTKKAMLFGVARDTDGTLSSQAWSFDAGGLCTISISPTVNAFPFSSQGGSSQVSVNTPQGCPWSASTDQSWITISPQSGTGPALLTVTSPANPGPFLRQGTVTFSGGVEYKTSQDPPPCPGVSSVLPPSPFYLRHSCVSTFIWNATAGQQFALRSIFLALSDNGAATPLFSITGPEPSPSILAVSGFGGAQDPVTLLPSSGVFTAPATGAYSVRLVWTSTTGASLVDWMQTGSACTPTIQQYSSAGVPYIGFSFTLPASGPSNSWFSIGLAPSCAPVSVISTRHTPSTATAAAGYTKVSLTLSTNYTSFPRSAFLDAGATHYLVIQAPNACSYSMTPITIPSPGADRSSLTLQLTTSGTDCPWAVSSNVPWIQLYPLSGTGSATIRGTIYPNFGTSIRQGTVSAPNVEYNLIQSGVSPFTTTSMDRYVRLLYFSFFGRIPTDAEVAFQANSRQSREQLALNFLNSDEFNRVGRFVAGLYVGLLNRDAEYGGWLFQRDALTTGITNETSVVDNFLNSPEFQLKNGTLPDRAFVSLLYRQVLLREPTQPEVDFQAGALAQLTRTQLARNFLSSNEFRLGTGPRLTAFLAWACLLQRDPTVAEFTADVIKLQQILSIGDASARLDAIRDRVLGPIANSPELNGIIQ